MGKKKQFPLIEDVTIEKLLEIAKKRYPEYSSYTQTFIIGKAVCIDKNALFRACIYIKHNKKRNESKLIVNEHITFLGALLAGPLWGAIIYRSFFNEVFEVFCEEIEKMTNK